MGKPDNWWVFTGFRVEEVVTGLNLPVNIAFVPRTSPNPTNPLFYATELYCAIKVATNEWSVHSYADNLLNYTTAYDIPGSGESGVTGLCVAPTALT